MTSGSEGKTMKHLYRQAGTLLVGAALLMTGCTGGDRTAGIEGTGDIVASGSVTAFGSIWVNGMRFETSDATFLVSGNLASEEAILPGMVVTVEGSVDAQGNAQAKKVVVDPLINGPITNVGRIGIPYSEITVLGQTVVIPEAVATAGVGAASLTVGLDVSVNGLVRSDGSILATRLTLREQTPFANVEGTVKSIDAEQFRLTLGALEVDYSNAQFINGNSDQLALGQRLKVESESALAPDGVLTATYITRKDNASPKVPGSRLVWEGVIEAFTSVNSFMLNDLVVDASSASVERGDSKQLGDGIRIMAAGKLNKHGVLVAESVKLLLPDQTRFSGTVEEMDVSSGQLAVLSTQFTSDALTTFEDFGSRNNRRINLADISSGDSVEVFGRLINDEWVATRIRRFDNAEGTTTFRGPVGEIFSDTAFMIMGVFVDASDAQGIELIAELAPGEFVAVEGIQTGRQAVQATRIEIISRSDCPESVAAACGAKPIGKPHPGKNEQY